MVPITTKPGVFSHARRRLLDQRWSKGSCGRILLLVVLIFLVLWRALSMEVLKVPSLEEKAKNSKDKGTAAWYPHTPPSNDETMEDRSPTLLADDHTKHILYFNTFYSQSDFSFGTGRRPFLGCPVHNCWAHPTTSATNSTSASSRGSKTIHTNTTTRIDDPNHIAYQDIDAVLFSVQANDHFHLTEQVREEIQSWRQPHQRFVFFMMESQAYPISNLSGMNGFFNWTMTYKWSSDIPSPYGWFRRKKSAITSISSEGTNETFSYAQRPPPGGAWIPYNEAVFLASLPERSDSFKALARRPGKVAWIVSNCQTNSQREVYVDRLREYIHVDVFGGSKGKCHEESTPCDLIYSRGGDTDNCTEYIRKNYKFYLSFENQFCNDYVTEKLFRRINDSVVITLGQGNYTAIAPPHSSINIFDFDSPKELADYLLELDQDDSKYLSYFWWKDHYEVHHFHSKQSKFDDHGQAMCRLCEKLHRPNQQEPPKAYENIHQWWLESAECGKRLPGLKARLASLSSLPGSHPKSPLGNLA